MDMFDMLKAFALFLQANANRLHDEAHEEAFPEGVFLRASSEVNDIFARRAAEQFLASRA